MNKAMKARAAKNESEQIALPQATTTSNVVPLRVPVHGIEPRCNCFDCPDVDEYDAPKTYADKLHAFVADLLAHGAVVTVVNTPSVAKTRRRA